MDENGSSSSSSSTDKIHQLRERIESLERKLILKQNEIKIANDAAQEYENELNAIRDAFNDQSKQLKETTTHNAELLIELRQRKDDIDQLLFDVSLFIQNLYCVTTIVQCQKLRDAENDRKSLLKEKERWNGMKEENEVVSDYLKKHELFRG